MFQKLNTPRFNQLEFDDTIDSLNLLSISLSFLLLSYYSRKFYILQSIQSSKFYD